MQRFARFKNIFIVTASVLLIFSVIFQELLQYFVSVVWAIEKDMAWASDLSKIDGNMEIHVALAITQGWFCRYSRLERDFTGLVTPNVWVGEKGWLVVEPVLWTWTQYKAYGRQRKKRNWPRTAHRTVWAGIRPIGLCKAYWFRPSRQN